MPTAEVLVNGQKITVDNSRFDVKFTRSVQQLDAGLSKAKKTLGMSIDTMGRYVNAQRKCVEGLTQAQIKLGQYVDEEGKVRTENGGFVADLTKIEQALGFYASEYGNRL